MKHPIALLNSQGGSVIIIALLLLAVMTIIGISSSKTSTIESFMVRNAGIYKQNLHIVDAAAMEALQKIVNMEFDTTLDDLNPKTTSFVWINSDDTWQKDNDWYSDFYAGSVLDASNSVVPDFILNDDVDLLSQRGQFDPENPVNTPLRYALVGWEAAPGSSMKATLPTRKAARVLAEYSTGGYGIMRVEIGVERKF